MYEKYEKMRDQCGLNNFQVAKETGIAPSMFTDWKMGRSKPKVDKLQKIAAVLKCSIEDIL